MKITLKSQVLKGKKYIAGMVLACLQTHSVKCSVAILDESAKDINYAEEKKSIVRGRSYWWGKCEYLMQLPSFVSVNQYAYGFPGKRHLFVRISLVPKLK